MEERLCRKCEKVKPLTDFTKNRRWFSHECKTCTNAKNRHSQGKNRKNWRERIQKWTEAKVKAIQEIKAGPCADCSRKFHYSQMDFDHVRGEKKKIVGFMTRNGYSLQTVLAEIDKCDLVCANCHRDRTQRRQASKPSGAGKYLQAAKDFVNSLKDGKPCADCADPHPYWRLDFDHRDKAQKTMCVSRIKNGKYSKDRILAEVAKCDLVCVNCHRLRTWQRQNPSQLPLAVVVPDEVRGPDLHLVLSGHDPTRPWLAETEIVELGNSTSHRVE